jgi:hypothetical protein
MSSYWRSYQYNPIVKSVQVQVGPPILRACSRQSQTENQTKPNPDKKQNESSTFKKKIGHKKMTLNEELVREKLEFVKLQKENFLEEHNAKMKLLKLQMKQFQKGNDTDTGP